jgi:hypothetical protein
MRLAQERLLACGRIMDQRPAVSVARHHEARCHILAQLGVQAVANGRVPPVLSLLGE